MTTAFDAAAAENRLVEIVGAAHVQRPAPALAQGAPPGAAWSVRPGAASEIADIVRLAGSANIAILPFGNAIRPPRQEFLGARPRIFVDLRRMNHIVDLDETSLCVTVQAGLTALALERVLAPRKLSLGEFPPAIMRSTIGGLLSVRTPGKSSTKHGFFEDAVMGVSGVLADGRAVHTRTAPRRASGPDLARALCGSEGTIGIITQAVLRIHRLPESRFLASHRLPSFDRAISAVYLALREDAAPAAMRVFDCHEARRHFGADAVEDGAAILVVATAGPTDLAACDRDLVASAVVAEGGESNGTEYAEAWWALRNGRAEMPGGVPHLQVAAAPGSLRTIFRVVTEMARAAGHTASAHASRFDADGAVLFFSFRDDRDRRLEGEILAGLRANCERAARDSGGFLLGSSTPDIDTYVRQLRTELDPLQILNPGALR